MKLEECKIGSIVRVNKPSYLRYGELGVIKGLTKTSSGDMIVIELDYITHDVLVINPDALILI